MTKEERKRVEAYVRDYDARSIAEMLVEVEKESDRLRHAIRWALGEHGKFRPRGDGEGAYYWRTELRNRARLDYPRLGPDLCPIHGTLELGFRCPERESEGGDRG